MVRDPTAEMKRIRHELGAADGFNVGRIFARLRQMEGNPNAKSFTDRHAESRITKR